MGLKTLNTQTGATASARNNESGSYTIPYLLPGVYDLVAEFSGFKKTQRRGIEVHVGDVLRCWSSAATRKACRSAR